MSGRKLPALNQLQGVLLVLENRAKNTPGQVLAAVGEMVRDAIAVLREPDGLKQHIGFVLLAIQQSTEVKEYKIRGKLVTRVKVTDLLLYNWAMAEVHKMSAACR